MTDDNGVLMRVKDLTKTYPDGHVTALSDVSFSIRSGDFVAIMGPSGCGKSTLLSLLGALEEPSAGTIYFESKPLAAWGNLDRFRAQKIGFVFQSFHLLPTLTALENVQLPMFETDLPRTAREAKAQQLLEQVSMSHRANHLPPKLSVGERQRVAIARSLANDPPLLLADEPTGNLDRRSGLEIMAILQELNRKGRTIVLITHDARMAAHADRILTLHDGAITEERNLGQTLDAGMELAELLAERGA